MMEDPAVSNFREYLRIPSYHPNIDYSKCVTLIQRLAKEGGLDCSIFGKPEKPVVVLTWKGKESNAGSILLNSHMDVVPVYKEQWSHDPFGSFKDEHGNIYGRGAQDTKCTGIQHIAAVKRLKDNGVIPKRTIHLSFVPDEEIGGKEGMGYFVETNDFKKLNIVFAIDEGCPCPDNKYAAFYGEKTSAKMEIHCCGTAGHGSLLHLNTAGEKLQKVLASFMDYRKTQKLYLGNEPGDIEKLPHVTTVNLTKIEGGVQNNVVPPEFKLTFDVRLSVDEDHDKFYKWVENVCKNAGDGVYCKYLEKEPKCPKTAIDSTNSYWIAFKNVIEAKNIPMKTLCAYGTTDMRYLRRLGIPAIGFSPMRYTPSRLHDNNEVINESIFLEGIEIYADLILALANIS